MRPSFWLRSNVERVRTSLWLGPGLAAVLGVLAAKLLPLADRALIDDRAAWYLFAGQPDSAREILSTVASSMMTFTGLVFSITIVVLQLASSQFSPRVLRTFLEDGVTKLAMATFVGSFTYSLALLPEVRSAGPDEQGAFVPGLSVFVASALAVASVLVFVRYIHHMAHSIRAVQVVRRVADETHATIVRRYPDPFSTTPDAEPPALPERDARTVCNDDRRGVLAEVDEERLVTLAARHDVVIALVPVIGAFVPRGAPLFRVWGGSPSDREALVQCVALAPERTPRQDPLFGFRQLVDVAERALSPGTNDPSTAVQAFDELHDLLRVLVTRRCCAGMQTDERGCPRVYAPSPPFDAFVHLAFDEIRRAGAGSVLVVRRLRSALLDLHELAPVERRAVLHEQLELLDRAAADHFDDQEWSTVLGRDAAGRERPELPPVGS